MFVQPSVQTELHTFLTDFNRMKQKINSLLVKQKEHEDKIVNLQDMVDRLTAENTKVNSDMNILREEHTEVLHQLFTFEKRNKDLLRENNELRSIDQGEL